MSNSTGGVQAMFPKTSGWGTGPVSTLLDFEGGVWLVRGGWYVGPQGLPWQTRMNLDV